MTRQTLTRFVFFFILIVAADILYAATADTAAAARPFQTRAFSNPGLQGPEVTAFRTAFLLSLVFGALGGFVYELIILQGRIELPHKSKPGESREQPAYAISRYMVDLGCTARILIGALAGILVLWALAPSTMPGVMAASLIAGSAGTSVFRSMQDRMLATVARRDAVEAQRRAKAQAEKVAEAQDAFQVLARRLKQESDSAAGRSTMRFPSLSLEPDDLDRVGMLLSEARGMGGTIKADFS